MAFNLEGHPLSIMSTYRSAKGGSNMQASKEKVGRFEGWIREEVPTDQEREEQRSAHSDVTLLSLLN